MLAARTNMILNQLYTNDIHDPRLLDVMAQIPREEFVPVNIRHTAYVDQDIVIGQRSLLAPLTLAKLLDLAKINKDSRVLDIGGGNGYGTAVVSRIAGEVVAIETEAELIAEAKKHLARLHITNVRHELVPTLAAGYATLAPFDVIVIHGAVRAIPDILGEQLGMGGRLVAILNIATRPGLKGGLGKGLLVKKIDHQLQHRQYFDAATQILPGF